MWALERWRWTSGRNRGASTYYEVDFEVWLASWTEWIDTTVLLLVFNILLGGLKILVDTWEADELK
jgi:hypothetical protein